MNGVLLDTSFLITLADRARRHHDAALAYFRACMTHRVPMHLSSIVMAEFQVGQPVADLPLRNLFVLPFNAEHAVRCGELLAAHLRDSGDDRVRVKDDFKLIAQCQTEGISHLITEDASTLVKYLERCRTGAARVQCILLRDGFDPSWFENGQYRLTD